MTQENGMPIKFELVEKDTGKRVNIFTEESFDLDPVYLDEKRFAWRQAIGATDSSDPKLELYLGDLIEVAPIKDITKYPMIGELVWHKFGVYLRRWNTFERDFEYWSFHSFIKSKTPLKKLGSRYDPKMEKILRKAGLLDNEDQ